MVASRYGSTREIAEAIELRGRPTWLFRGIGAGFDGRAWLDQWSADPWSRGSYAAFLPGQVTGFLGAIARAEGGLHFAGEHTSVAYQGFLEGAVASGERCAQEVLASGAAALHGATAFA